MNAPPPISRGIRTLRRLLREQTCDVRQLDVEGFRHWLDRHLARWQHDPAFVQRVRIRDLRRSCPELRALEQDHRRIVALDAASPQFARLQELERDLAGTNKAIAGLSGALARVSRERRPAVRAKLAAFRARRKSLEAEQANLIASSPERQALLRIEAELRRLRTTTGLEREETRLARLLRERGRSGGRAGQSFERTALAITESRIVPDLLPRSNSTAALRVHVLRGVTLGAARLEFDNLVVREPPRPGEPVEVLAVVEAKRNINDLAHGFRQRQDDLAWLTGDAARYEPERYRTKLFRSGHFDQPAEHHEGGNRFQFDGRSFRRFRRDPDSGLFLDRLYFITRVGPVWGLSGAALQRVGYRVATDEHWDPDDPTSIRRLRRWCRSLAEPFETPDVLGMYAATPQRGRQIVIVARPRVEGGA